MYLGCTLRCTSCSLPGGIGRANQPPTRPCSRQGLPCLSPCGESGGLLPHLFTLTLPLVGRSVFCGTIPRLAPAGYYPVSCPVEPGLSSGVIPPASTFPTGDICYSLFILLFSTFILCNLQHFIPKLFKFIVISSLWCEYMNNDRAYIYEFPRSRISL